MRYPTMLGALAMLLGCADTESPEAALERLCASPQRYEGDEVRLPGPFALDESFGGCTAAACGDACCNACTYDYLVPCPAGSTVESVRLLGGPELGPFLDAADWGSVHLSPGIDVITLGCVGDSCGPRECTPAEPSRFSWAAGTVSVDASGRPTLLVTAVDWE